ncbi:MAG: HU family DNA-binding protein [Tannerella sp.]|jgi:predicted histone-like DNA-binding protein|nr:HU family DNA-binding protein [Tannerella sp.]
MKFKVIERNNPQQPTAPKKQYASPVNAGKFTIKDFAKEIAGRSSLSRGDIENVLSNFVEELPTFLKLGLSVKLGDFGTFRLNLQSEGVEPGQKFTAANIKGVKVIFTPGSELKTSLADTTFEEA